MTTTSKLNLTKVEQFARQVGIDYKSLNEKVASIEQLVNGKATPAQITEAVRQLKNELLNGVGAEFDTLKELADKLKDVEKGAIGQTVLAKLTEMREQLNSLEQLDLMSAYTQAKLTGA